MYVIADSERVVSSCSCNAPCTHRLVWSRRFVGMAECEGFICPLCMKDFQGVAQLEQHFQDEHAETTQSRFRSNLKSLIGKLKKRV